MNNERNFSTPNPNTLHKDNAKILTYVTGVIFVICLIVYAGLSVYTIRTGNYSSGDFMYAVITSGGVFGACVAFYLNIERVGQITHMRMAYIHFVTVIKGHLTPDEWEAIYDELVQIDDTLKNGVVSAHEQATQTEIDIQHY
jgi:hypothetical protein